MPVLKDTHTTVEQVASSWAAVGCRIASFFYFFASEAVIRLPSPSFCLPPPRTLLVLPFFLDRYPSPPASPIPVLCLRCFFFLLPETLFYSPECFRLPFSLHTSEANQSPPAYAALQLPLLKTTSPHVNFLSPPFLLDRLLTTLHSLTLSSIPSLSWRVHEDYQLAPLRILYCTLAQSCVGLLHLNLWTAAFHGM